MDIKSPGNFLYIIGKTFKELGGSEYYKLNGHMGKTVPKVHTIKSKKTFKAVTKAIDLGLIKACHDLSEGGLAVSAAEMALAGDYGLEFDLRKVPNKGVNRNDFMLFSESNSRFLVEVPEKTRYDFETTMKGVVCAKIGGVAKKPKLIVHGLDGKVAVEASLKDLRSSWKVTLRRERRK
jgi:phosphoribosylformylglycinamidine (FGAM) synthase-like enzyme